MYSSFACVLVTTSTLDGIAPPLSLRKEERPMVCSDGRLPELYFPVERSFCMAELYGVRISLLLAFGLIDGAIHQMCVKESLTLFLSTFTHWAGLGNRARLCATNCWHRWRLPRSRNSISVFIASVDITGFPGSHALPISIAIEPFFVSISRNFSAKETSHSLYSSPCRLPYLFFLFRGNGGDVRMSWTLPRYRRNCSDARTSSASPSYIAPCVVL